MKLSYLREHLIQLLKTLNNNVYYEKADDEGLFPHVVFSLSKVKSFNRSDFILEVNVWDNMEKSENGTIRLEDLTDDIEDLFDEYSFIDDQMQFRTYKSTRNNVEDTNKNLRRRRLTFTLLLYGR